jgi:hypothetical protein
MENIKAELVSGENIDSSQFAIPERSEKPSIGAIPDMDILTRHVLEIIEYLEQEDVLEKCKKDDHIIMNELNNKYYKTVPYPMLKLLMDFENREENVERILRILDTLVEAKQGKINLEDAEKNLTDEVNERYVYRKYGSKENFEYELAKAVEQERKGMSTGI